MYSVKYVLQLRKVFKYQYYSNTIISIQSGINGTQNLWKIKKRNSERYKR